MLAQNSENVSVKEIIEIDEKYILMSLKLPATQFRRDSVFPESKKYLYNICTMLDQREDVEPTLYKCYTNVLCQLG